MKLKEIIELEEIGIKKSILKKRFEIYRKYLYYDMIFWVALNKIKKDENMKKYLIEKLKRKFGIEI